MLDIVLGAILAVSVFLAARNGITKEVVRIVALIGGLITAMWGHDALALELRPWIESERAAACVAFALLFLACLLAGSLLAYLLAGAWRLTGMAWVDMALGAAFGLVRGLLVAAGLLLGMVAFQPFAGTSSLVAESKIAPWVMNVARTATQAAPRAFRETFGRGAAQVEEERAETRS